MLEILCFVNRGASYDTNHIFQSMYKINRVQKSW
jgi:hypothetical protein